MFISIPRMSVSLLAGSMARGGLGYIIVDRKGDKRDV